MADDETEKAVTAVPPSVEINQPTATANLVSANEEPMIEIPLTTGSHVFKMRVSLTDFCKLPIRDIGIYNNETAANSTTASPMLNSSFCMQIGSTSSSCVVEGEKVVRKSVAVNRGLNRLPTQIGIAESGEVRTDFPFDDPNLSKKEKEHLKFSTLMAPVVSKQPSATILASDTETDVSSSFVFGDPSHISETSLSSPMMMVGGSSQDAAVQGESEEGDSSHEKTFPTDNSIMSGRSNDHGRLCSTCR